MNRLNSLIEETKTAITMKPGQKVIVDYEYMRHGDKYIYGPMNH